MDVLNSGAYRGRLRNIASYTLFKPASSSYSVDGENSKGEVDFILVDGAQRSVFLTVFSGGMVVLRNHKTIIQIGDDSNVPITYPHLQ